MLIAASNPESVTLLRSALKVTVTPLGAETLLKSRVPNCADSFSVIGSGLLLLSTPLDMAPNCCRLVLLNARRVASLVDWAPGFLRLGYAVPTRMLFWPVLVKYTVRSGAKATWRASETVAAVFTPSTLPALPLPTSTALSKLLIRLMVFAESGA